MESVVETPNPEHLVKTQLDTDKIGISESLADGEIVGSSSADTNAQARYPPHSIAIVGMAGRFPDAESVEDLWDLIVRGKNTVESAPSSRLGLDEIDADHPPKPWWGNFLRNPEDFDHNFFKIKAKEARTWDPQQRILLEVSYEALEDAGYFGAASAPEARDYGCYIGAVMNNYYDNVSCHKPSAYATMGTSRCYISGAVSHFFGWTGPAITMDTACSSSLVAINAACKAIIAGECSRAIAGGTNVITSPYDYRNLAAAGFLSPTGQCKPFDRDADGYCRAEGVGVVVLKSLATAIEENDHVLGVIVGSAVNQSPGEGHIAVPNSLSQVSLQKKAMLLAGLSPEDISYVEAHGTGTRVGDPTEIAAIRETYCKPRRMSPLHVSSIKGNIGHTEASAGVAGLIKVLQMMRHRMIPPQANHSILHPAIPPLEPDNIVISQELTRWAGRDLAACVASYGAAGSNAVVFVREMRRRQLLTSVETAAASYSGYRLPLFVAAATEHSLSTYCSRLLHWLKKLRARQPIGLRLLDVLFNIADRANHSLHFALSTTVSDLDDLESKLAEASRGRVVGTTEHPSKPTILLLGGQVKRYVGLSRKSHREWHLLRHHLDQCQDALIAQGHRGIYPGIFQSTPLPDIATLHAALFAIQYASAKAWIDAGLKIDAVLGHSIGHMSALCVCGALSLADGLRLVMGRASLIQTHWGSEPGTMLSLRASRHEVEQLLETLKEKIDYAEIACFNGPRNQVVVGSTDTIELVEKYIDDRPHLRHSLHKLRLPVTHGFHSMYTETLLPRLADLARTLEWKVPTIQLETCDETGSSAMPDYQSITRHMRRPVLFQQAVERLALKFSKCCWFSAEQDPAIVRLARKSLSQDEGHSFVCADPAGADGHYCLAQMTVELWNEGQTVQYWPFHRRRKHKYQRMVLPPYAFERSRHWLPFTSKRAVENTVAVDTTTCSSEDGLMSLASHDGAGNAKFHVSPRSARFQLLCDGHMMSGEALAPASLYFEMAARAALVLNADARPQVWAPSLHGLTMNAPVGKDSATMISLVMKRQKTMEHSWSFSVVTQQPPSTGRHSDQPRERLNGQISLRHADGRALMRGHRLFHELDVRHRYQRITGDPVSGKMRGKHIYRAFHSVVKYGDAFKNIESIACTGTEAAGELHLAPRSDNTAASFAVDTIVIDSFMQPAGFLVNYFNNGDFEDSLFVCQHVEHIEMGNGSFPRSGRFCFYTEMRLDALGIVFADVYVFDGNRGEVGFIALGLRFARLRRTSLARTLTAVNRSSVESLPQYGTERPPGETAEDSYSPSKAELLSSETYDRRRAFEILADASGKTVGQIPETVSLEDLGIDSLAAIEVLNDVRESFGMEIPLSTLMSFLTVEAFLEYIVSRPTVQRQGKACDDSDQHDPKSVVIPVPTADQHKQHESGGNVSGCQRSRDSISAVQPILTAGLSSFQSFRLMFDSLAADVDYCVRVYPDHVRLLRAYILEAFARLGCDIKGTKPGRLITQPGQVLSRHHRLVQRLLMVLVEADFVVRDGDVFLRTEQPIEETLAQGIYDAVRVKAPEYASMNQLLHALGSRLDKCLTGDENGLQIMFGVETNQKALADFYENWPLFEVATKILAEFVRHTLTEHGVMERFRILEVGAGTGGTTRLLVNALQESGVPFDYHFTDISPSLVKAAKTSFGGVAGMSFGVLDIEKQPSEGVRGGFDVVVASNCIHATRDIEHSLVNLRRMLRGDGVLAMIELTKNLAIFDLLFGLLDGWWLSTDDRSHALVDECVWQQKMESAGFQDISWTDGDRPDAKIVRLITGFAQTSLGADIQRDAGRSRVHEVVYKKTDSCDIFADVYCPTDPNPRQALPIGESAHQARS